MHKEYPENNPSGFFMQEITLINKPLNSLPSEDRQKLVEVFAWLIQEDKKQHPELYKLKKEQND